MDISRLLNMPCTITSVTEGAVDVLGDPTEETSTTTTVCWITRSTAAQNSTEDNGWTVDTLDLYLPPDAVLDGDDRVTVSGVTYQVLGPPHTHTHPRTLEPVYVGATVRRAT